MVEPTLLVAAAGSTVLDDSVERNGCNIREIRENGIAVIARNWRESFIEVDWVVLARGVVPVRDLAEQMAGKAAEARNIASAIYEGSVVARSI